MLALERVHPGLVDEEAGAVRVRVAVFVRPDGALNRLGRPQLQDVQADRIHGRVRQRDDRTGEQPAGFD